MNKVILVGRLTRDIEVRYGQTGLAIGKTGIATSRKYKTQSGEQRDDVMFVDLTFFGRTAEMAQQYFRKGSRIAVDGRLVLEQWVDQSGGKRSKHSVSVENLEFIDTKAESQQNTSYQNQNGGNQGYGNQNQYGNQQPQQGGGYNGGGNYNNNNSYQQNNQQANSNGNQQNKATNPADNTSPNSWKSSDKDDIPEIDIDDMDDQVPF